jgi:hypothetical protein
MQITDLSPREQEAIEFAFVRYTWPGRDANEGLVIQTKYQVEQYAKQMDEAEFEKLYTDWQSLPPDQQENIAKVIDAAVQKNQPPLEKPAAA